MEKNIILKSFEKQYIFNYFNDFVNKYSLKYSFKSEELWNFLKDEYKITTSDMIVRKVVSQTKQKTKYFIKIKKRNVVLVFKCSYQNRKVIEKIKIYFHPNETDFIHTDLQINLESFKK